MAIKINVGKTDAKDQNKIKIKISKNSNPLKDTINLDLKKTIDGKFYIDDHSAITIVIDPVNLKGYLYSKDGYKVATQDIMFDLMDFLFQRGLVRKEDVEGGSVYGSLQFKVKLPTEEQEVGSFEMEGGSEGDEEAVKGLYILLMNLWDWVEQNRGEDDLVQDVIGNRIENDFNEENIEMSDPEDIKNREKQYSDKSYYGMGQAFNGVYYPIAGAYLLEKILNNKETKNVEE